jgi:hypothetical protein
MFLTEYDEKGTMRRQARDNREEGRKEGRAALKKATEYLKENGRTSEIEELIFSDDFFDSVIREAGIEFEESSADEA